VLYNRCRIADEDGGDPFKLLNLLFVVIASGGSGDKLSALTPRSRGELGVVYHDCAAHIQRVSQVTEIVHGKWKLRILCAMRTKPVRLSQLMRYPGASKKALRASLRPWNRRMVVRRDMSGAVLHVEYDFADDMRGIVGFSSRQYGGLGSDPLDQAKRPHASLMNFEAQPRRITAVTEPAKPWFVSWDLCRPPQTVHIGDRCFEVRHAKEHQKTQFGSPPWRPTLNEGVCHGHHLHVTWNCDAADQ